MNFHHCGYRCQYESISACVIVKSAFKRNLLTNIFSKLCRVALWTQLVEQRINRLKCKLKCYVKPMKDPLGVSPSKGNQGTTWGKEKILFDLGGNRFPPTIPNKSLGTLAHFSSICQGNLSVHPPPPNSMLLIVMKLPFLVSNIVRGEGGSLFHWCH